LCYVGIDGYHSFRLACNIHGCGKFDDVAICYRRNEYESEKVRLIQTKNTKSFITCEEDLLGRKKEASLPKYFESYRDLKESTVTGMRLNYIEELVICSSADISYDVRQSPKLQFQEVHEKGIFLLSDHAKSVRFKIEAPDELLLVIGGISDLGSTPSVPKKIRLSSENEQEEKEDVRRFLKLLTLAVGQPDHNELKEKIQKNIRLLAPFSTMEDGQIYLSLEEKMENWYSAATGFWLTKEIFLDWVAKSSNQRVEQINPWLSSPITGEIKWEHLNEAAKNCLLSESVEFQGDLMQLRQLINFEEAGNVMSPEVIKLLTREHHITIGRPFEDSNGYNSKWYIPRTIHWPILGEVEGEKQIKICNSEDEFDTSNEKALLVVDGERGVIMKFKGKIEEIGELISENNSHPQSEEELIKRVEGLAIIADTAGMGKTTILSHFHHILKQARLNTWVLQFELNDLSNEMKALQKGQGRGFLEQLADLKNELEKQLFLHLVNRKGDIVLLFDGFDEIPDNNNNNNNNNNVLHLI
jgi:NACHT domain